MERRTGLLAATYGLSSATARLGRVMGRLAGWVYLVCALFVTFDVLTRRFLGFSSQGTTEISGYMLAFGLSWALAAALADKAHIRVDFLVMRVPLGVRVYLHALALAFLALFGLLLAWLGWRVVSESAAFGALDPTPFAIPLVVPQGLWAFGISVFALLTVLLLLHTLLLMVCGERERIDRMLGSKSAEEETAEALDALGVRLARPTSDAAAAAERPPRGDDPRREP